MALAVDTVLNAALSARLISRADASRLRTALRAPGADTVDALSCAARVPSSAIYHALAGAQGIPFVDASKLTPDPELVRRVPRILMLRKQVLPLSQGTAGVLVVCAESADQQTRDALHRALGAPIQIALAEPRELRAAIDRQTGALPRLHEGGETGTVGTKPGTALFLPAVAPGQEAVALLDEVFREGYVRRATDIHLEPQAGGFRVRYRVDGHLQVFRSAIAAELGAAVLSRVKVLASLDIAESRAAQDGSFTVKIPGVSAGIDLRVATAPTREGERATIRILGTDTEDLSLETLGMPPAMLTLFRTAIKQPHGLILNTGATGCGKTTTLYAALREINSPDLNIVTVEDPVEYPIAGVSQLQVDHVGKVTFAGALRSLLRHDPDVIMIGEVRDTETADIAIRSAMTGHLVFSTLHTNTAAGAVSRLIDMGCEPYLLASTLSLVIAQRLVRRLCPYCRRPRTPDPAEIRFLSEEVSAFHADEPLSARTTELSAEHAPHANGRTADAAAPTGVFDPAGCIRCVNTGYRGRIGLFEMFRINGALPRDIARAVPEHELVASARRQGVEPLVADARRKVFEGITSLSEARAALVVEG